MFVVIGCNCKLFMSLLLARSKKTYQTCAASTQLLPSNWSPSAVKAAEASAVKGEHSIIAAVSAHFSSDAGGIIGPMLAACIAAKFGVRGVTGDIIGDWKRPKPRCSRLRGAIS